MIQVFIGSENPIKEINEFTLITGKYQLPEGEPFDSTQGKQGFVSIIGPKEWIINTIWLWLNILVSF